MNTDNKWLSSILTFIFALAVLILPLYFSMNCKGLTLNKERARKTLLNSYLKQLSIFVDYYYDEHNKLPDYEEVKNTFLKITGEKNQNFQMQYIIIENHNLKYMLIMSNQENEESIIKR